MDLKYLNQHKILLLYLIPIINYIFYIFITFLRDPVGGFAELIFSLISLPIVVIRQIILYFALQLFNEESNIPINILIFGATYSILFYLLKIILYVPLSMNDQYELTDDDIKFLNQNLKKSDKVRRKIVL
jgi:hypothetical protein